MKIIPATGVALILALLLGVPQVSMAGQWYVGGTLQDATISQWQEASYGNKLASAAIWAIMEPDVRKISQKSSTMATVKPYAEELVGCIERLSADAGSNKNVSSLAAACMVILGW